MLITELFSRLATLSADEGDEIQQLVYLEKEMSPASLTKKPELMLGVDEEAKKHVESSQLLEKATQAYQAGDLAKPLLYFELLQHFQETDSTWRGKLYNEHHDDPIINKLTEITLQLGAQPGGPAILEANLHDLGPLASIVHFSSYVSLALYYARQNQSDKVVHFASLVWPYLHLTAAEHPQSHDVRVACQFSLALLITHDITSAVQKVSGCVSSAEALGDPELLFAAHSINVWILGAAGKADQAAQSEEYLRLHPYRSANGLLAVAAAQQSAGDWNSALDTLHSVLRVAETNKDTATLASTHLRIANLISAGVVTDDLGREGHLKQAELLFTQLSDDVDLAEVNLQLAALYIARRDWQKADARVQRAMQLSTPLKRSDLEARATSLRGERYRASGDPNRALDLFRQSAQIYHDHGEKAKEAGELLLQAEVLGNDLYQPRDALGLALKAQDLAQLSNDSSQIIASLRVISDFNLTLGDYPAALNALDDALAITKTQQAVLMSAYIELQRCEALVVIGEWEAALKAINAALPVVKQFKDRNSIFSAYMELIYVYSARESELQDFDKALEYAKELKQLVGDLSPAQSASLSLASYEIQYQQDHFDEAIEDAKSALSYSEKENNKALQAGALLSLAESQRSKGELANAEQALNRAWPLVTSSGDYYLKGRFYYGQANLYKRQGQLQRAIDDYDKVIEILERYKATNGHRNIQTVSETYNYIYGELIDTYYMLAQADNAFAQTAASKSFEIAELNKSRTFTTTWGRSLIDALRRKLSPALQEEEQKIIEQSAALQDELNRSEEMGGRPKKQIEAELQKLSTQEASFEVELRRDYPIYADARYPRRMTIADLPLRPGEMLVEFKMFDPALFVWIVKGTETGPQVVSFYKVRLKRDWFKERIVDIRDAMNRGDLDGFDPKVSEELFNAIFLPRAAELLRSANSVIFIPDDILCLLPLEILSHVQRTKILF